MFGPPFGVRSTGSDVLRCRDAPSPPPPQRRRGPRSHSGCRTPSAASGGAEFGGDGERAIAAAVRAAAIWAEDAAADGRRPLPPFHTRDALPQLRRDPQRTQWLYRQYMEWLGGGSLPRARDAMVELAARVARGRELHSGGGASPSSTAAPSPGGGGAAASSEPFASLSPQRGTHTAPPPPPRLSPLGREPLCSDPETPPSPGIAAQQEPPEVPQERQAAAVTEAIAAVRGEMVREVRAVVKAQRAEAQALRDALRLCEEKLESREGELAAAREAAAAEVAEGERRLEQLQAEADQLRGRLCELETRGGGPAPCPGGAPCDLDGLLDTVRERCEQTAQLSAVPEMLACLRRRSEIRPDGLHLLWAKCYLRRPAAGLLAALAESGNRCGVARVDLSQNRLSDAEVPALAAAVRAMVPGLRAMDLRYNQLSPEGCFTLQAAAAAAQVRVTLGGNALPGSAFDSASAARWSSPRASLAGGQWWTPRASQASPVPRVPTPSVTPSAISVRSESPPAQVAGLPLWGVLERHCSAGGIAAAGDLADHLRRRTRASAAPDGGHELALQWGASHLGRPLNAVLAALAEGAAAARVVHIDLRGNRVTDAHADALEGLIAAAAPPLRGLDLRRNAVSATAAARLERAGEGRGCVVHWAPHAEHSPAASDARSPTVPRRPPPQPAGEDGGEAQEGQRPPLAPRGDPSTPAGRPAPRMPGLQISPPPTPSLPRAQGPLLTPNSGARGLQPLSPHESKADRRGSAGRGRGGAAAQQPQ
eukprot:TRINITY_DN8309_c0_g2_i1.p1 TRINITY_DN8309_c0_g2~~TRINITY_DN8309_c0_g2_i1.p1  ORF type:complete len:765 (+),score=186.79 TRINITY_DN8309_c0_g2_i1:78-2372(+)